MVDYKLPKTVHIHGSMLYRDDLQLSEEETLNLFSNDLIIQEKLDGANIGFQFNRDCDLIAFNRNHKLNFNSVMDTQFKKLYEWTSNNFNELFHVLGEDRVLFGEWLYAKHSINYDKLPSYFMAFDIFDKKERKFIAQRRVKEDLVSTSLQHNPILYEGKINGLTELEELITTSQFGSESMEGLYLRVDDTNYNLQRNKFVCSEFQQNIDEHWKNLPLKLNKSLDFMERSWSE